MNEFDRIHPDGAPGVYDSMYRQFLGDKNYEIKAEREAVDWELKVDRETASIESIRNKNTVRSILAGSVFVISLAVSIVLIGSVF